MAGLCCEVHRSKAQGGVDGLNLLVVWFVFFLFSFFKTFILYLYICIFVGISFSVFCCPFTFTSCGYLFFIDSLDFCAGAREALDVGHPPGGGRLLVADKWGQH